MEIGSGEGEEALFRVTSAARLPDGRIAVANAGTQQVKLFGARGEHLASLGGRGSGPGEFQVPTWAGARGDSILVWDAALERLTVFDGAGRVARTTQFPPAGGAFPSVIGVFGDGSLLLASGTDPAAAAREGRAWRGSTALIRVGPAGRVLDTLATVPSDERYSRPGDDQAGIVVEDLPFGRRTVMAVAADRVVLGTGEDYRIRSVDTAGASREMFRAAWTPRLVSSADVEEYWRRMVTLGGRSGDPEARPSRVPYPKTLPPYEDLALDPRGALWIKDAQPPEGWDDPDLWRVYSPSGAPMATIEFPARTRLHAIGDDWILCSALDASHRELVRLYGYGRR